MYRLIVTILMCIAALHPARATGPALSIVAAESVYGDVAAQIAGPGVPVESILRNPDQDPHLFEASPSVARALAQAGIAIANGAEYDPWMTRLLAATPSPQRETILVADLLHRHAGDNPHLWYDDQALKRVAAALQQALSRQDPARASLYRSREERFDASLAALDTRIAAFRARFAGIPVTASEPVFGLMAAALGLSMRNERFQLAVMNGTEPAASDIAAFETDLRAHRVRAMLYNSQATDAPVTRLLAIARGAGIPVVPVTETLPPGLHAQGWMLGEIDALERALSSS